MNYKSVELGRPGRSFLQRLAHKSSLTSHVPCVVMAELGPCLSSLTAQPARGTLPPLPGSDDSDYFHHHLSPHSSSLFPQPPKPIIDQSSFNLRQFPFLLRNLWLVKGTRVVLMAGGGEEGLLSFKGEGLLLVLRWPGGNRVPSVEL